MAQIAIRLHLLGHYVAVGCLRAEGPLLGLLQEAGVTVIEFRKERTLLSSNGAYQLLRLAAFLRRGKFHVLHAHDLWANLLGVPAARLARTPIIISSRRYLEDLDWYKPWKNKVMGMIYRLSTHVVVNCKAVKTLLMGRHGLPADKMRVIYNGVDVDSFAGACADRQRLLPGLTDDAELIAVLANLYKVKGHVHLIAAARQICRVFPKATFILIGDGPARVELEQQVREAGLEKKFWFLGRRKDVAELLACCRLSVLPSEAEALPNAALEAMAAGVPVVATSVGGIPEIIEDRANGLLVSPKSPRLLAEAIVEILRDPLLAQTLARTGQERMRTNFGFDRVVAELTQLYGIESDRFPATCSLLPA